MNSQNDKALSVKDVALLLNVTERTIYRLAQKKMVCRALRWPEPGDSCAETYRSG